MTTKQRIASAVCLAGITVLLCAVFIDSMRLGMFSALLVFASIPWLPEPFDTDDSGIEHADPSIAHPADRVGR